MTMPSSLPSQSTALTPPATSTHPQTRKLEPYDLDHFINPRADLVNELIERVHHYHIIRVIGPPASGKTTAMKLMQEVCSAASWAHYLEQKTGCHGRNWRSNPAYLLLDESQQTYWDSKLWTVLFKSVEPGWSVFIVLFTSYGSPGEGLEGFEREMYSAVPMNFGNKQEILLWPEEIGLLLDENEAMDVVTRYASAVLQPSFLTSNGHVGLLTSLTHVLHDVPELYDLTAVAHDGIYKAILWTESKEFKYALRDIWRNGWLHAVESNWDIRYIFASQIHRWFCQCLLTKISSEPDIAIPLPLAAVEATTNLQPHQQPAMQATQ
ncbi:hypothetical protein BDV41DRAFT_568247 [Aspergillus transmontanensis]|uniref:P-loop containing nucleoside triphosphate hydrolase protein n=1 Tax=Aspergillus transmontanensis TaxID=1034304 RepID=A0A5N6VJM1_9EURO|nr:hypothetical protein BDV41DRAFT_568247 [Aspergillus transmontanensis]